MDGATVGVGPVSRARTLGMEPRLMLTRLGRDIGAVETLEHRLLVALVPG